MKGYSLQKAQNMLKINRKKSEDNMRDFEKISFEQFKKDVVDDIDLYDEYRLPQRDSNSTAGYDIYLLEDLAIEPNEIKKIPTGIKSFFEKDEVLFLIVRSSMGFKYNIRLCNQVGVIDADYYNNESNEGHMYVALQNEGTKDFVINKGDAYAQGIIIKYLTCGEENNQKRTGGIGSTNN